MKKTYFESFNKLRVNSSREAFTLTELLIVIGIIGILIAISFASYASIRQRRQVKVVAEQIKSRIVEARSYAMTPRDGASGLTSVDVVIDTSNNTLKISERRPSAPSDILTDQLPSLSNIKITPITPTARPIVISFIANDSNKMGQATNEVDTPPYGKNIVFSIGKPDDTNRYQLTVNKYGGAVDIKAQP